MEIAAPIAQGTMRSTERDTVMDENSDKIVDMSVVQVTEVTSSYEMEAEGCKRCLDFSREVDISNSPHC